MVSTAAIVTQGFSKYIHKRANSISHSTYTDFGSSKETELLSDYPEKALSAIRSQLCISGSINPTTLQQTANEYANKNRPYRQCLEKVRDAGLCTLLHAAEIHLEDGLFSAWENGQVLMHDNMHQTYPAAFITAKGLMPQLREILKP